MQLQIHFFQFQNFNSFILKLCLLTLFSLCLRILSSSRNFVNSVHIPYETCFNLQLLSMNSFTKDFKSSKAQTSLTTPGQLWTRLILLSLLSHNFSRDSKEDSSDHNAQAIQKID